MFRNNDISDGGRAVLIAAPDYNATPIVSLAECKSALGIASSSQDALITMALDAAIAALDPSTNGWLGRALGAQTWELQLQSFCDRRKTVRPHYNPLAIPLPYPPLIAITSVKYFNAAGSDTTMVAGTDYRVLGQGETYARQAIAPLYGQSWPVARPDDASVRIRYTCGYDGQAGRMTPPQLSSAICLSVRALMPLLQRDATLLEDRVEGVASKRYQNNPEFARITEAAVSSLLVNLSIN
ncbi:phage head-tail connector protein [Bradyrhizobium sp. WSM4349]|uniref:phage head-tail connector protein n=1 Tax=Bradyrhizobium sp. WSM4349 TaxID=1040988 RepID=UPI00037BD46D|nr:phage head-tail connector protein [Bradyrhizobium sp. WSM4349]